MFLFLSHGRVRFYADAFDRSMRRMGDAGSSVLATTFGAGKKYPQTTRRFHAHARARRLLSHAAQPCHLRASGPPDEMSFSAVERKFILPDANY